MDAIKEGMLASAKAAEAAARIGERLFCQNTPNVMTFNSQICTSREQSERLLALGLKKETADMALYQKYAGDDDEGCMIFEEAISPKPSMWRNDIPAWSLHRLIEMVSHTQYPYYVISKELPIYDALCERIEWLIKEGYFNKEYLV
jgi:hypothetical protein